MSTYLIHHGIKGQKWGVRRFQNKDGSYTSKGIARYRNGKKLHKEHSEATNSEMNRLIKSSKKYKELNKKSQYILNKYGLDADDGGGGYTDRFTEKQLSTAADMYLRLEEDKHYLKEEFNDKAIKYADDLLKSKYGKQAADDMDFYLKTNGVIAAGTMMTILGGLYILNKKF